MEYKIFETHAHYDDEWYNEDRTELIRRLLDSDISYITNIGADIKTSINSVRLAEEFDRVFAAVGIHPDDVDSLKSLPEGEAVRTLRELASNPKVVAIGEIGLDYFEREEGQKNEEAS